MYKSKNRKTVWDHGNPNVLHWVQGNESDKHLPIF